MKVREILRHKGAGTVTVSPDDPAVMAARLMTELRIGSLVCLDQDNKIKGIISERDIVRC